MSAVPTADASTTGGPSEAEPHTEAAQQAGRRLSRRAMIGLLGAGATAGAGVAGGVAMATASGHPSTPQTRQTWDFHGVHQAGIATPAQDRLHFATFDLSTTSRGELVALLRSWTSAAEAMCAGRDVGAGAVTGSPDSPPDDTGEAFGLGAGRLTLTVGFGSSLFADQSGRDRFGLGSRRPAQLAELPSFPGDALDPARSGGDLCVQACADDPQVAVHAIRNLARIARGSASVRYSQLGFGRTSSTSTEQATPRNMMGFKDGTANLKAEDPAQLDEHVWVRPGDGPAWMVGGSYLVTRRIRMLIEPWDSTPLTEQERVIGRLKGSGAPIGGTGEFDPIDLTAVHGDAALIDEKAHVRLAHPDTNGGATLLRRGYSFVDGTDRRGRLDAGLFFMAYQRDPRRQFVTINSSLSGKNGDALNEYIQHVGSGLFAVPPGVRPGEYWGQALFA